MADRSDEFDGGDELLLAVALKQSRWRKTFVRHGLREGVNKCLRATLSSLT